MQLLGASTRPLIMVSTPNPPTGDAQMSQTLGPTMSGVTPGLSVVAPCFNEELVLPEFVKRTVATCRGLGLAIEVVLVDDGSSDGTWQVMTALAREYDELVLVKLSRNHGHQLALTAGLAICSGDRILIIDADLRIPPELLPAMLEKMQAGADVVYGQRLQREGETRFKLLSAMLFYRVMSWLSETPVPQDTGDFRLVSRRVLNVLQAMPERHRFIRGMVSWVGFTQVPFQYARQTRFAGTTKYPIRKMVRFAMDAITAFSTKPLAIASFLAMMTSIFGLGVLGYALVSWLYGRVVSGWTSMLGAMALLSSAQLLILGIIGEYVGRLYQQSKGRPLFVIEEIRRSADTAGVRPSKLTV